ncbi:hypothetical protein [Endozoicomonas sp. YOMI1]|uniref:hypothetical protein n=1 Tax=Endozoicomonas sp. YOMI1 TaxID=2828739 RepID=UPI002147A73D|nr:hypothetical protein [Endozoicomonas sp. YOMI1]
MFNLPRNPLCHRVPGVEGPGPIQTNYEQTPKEAEAPVGTHRGREIKSADTTSYLAEQESVVTGADSSSPIKAEATSVPAHHTTGLKENKLDSQDAKLLQERADLLKQADELLGTINEKKVVGISLEALEKARANGPEQVLVMLKSMEFPVGLNVKITLKSQPDKPLSLIPPGDELVSQQNLGKLMDKTIETLKRHDKQYANTEVRVSEAEKIRQFLVAKDNEVAGRDTLGQGEGAQAFDKLRNRRCAITVHHRIPVEQSYVEARHHDASPVAQSAAEESSAITAREDSSIKNGDGYTDEQDLTTTTSSGLQKQAVPIATAPPMDRPTQPATPVYPVPLPLVNSSQTIVPRQPEEAEPALPQSEQQATDSVEKTTQEQPNQSLPMDELQSTGSEASISAQKTQASLSGAENTGNVATAETAPVPAEQSDVQPAMTLQQAESSTTPTPKTEQTAKSQVRQPERQDNLHAALIREIENRQWKLKPTKSNQPTEGNSTQTSGRLSPNHDTANTPEASRPMSNPELMEELTKKLADIRPKTPEEVDTMDSNVARQWAQAAKRVKNDRLPFVDELMEKVAAKNRAMEETAQPYQPALSSAGYKPTETTVSFPPFPASDELPETASTESGQISPTQTDRKATDDIAVAKDETKNTSSSNKAFSDAKFKEELTKAVAKMLKRSSNTMDADDITDSSVSEDLFPKDLTADLNNIMNAALSPEEPGETAQPTLNKDATTPLPPPTPPTPPPISQEILLSARTRKAPASTSTAQANSPDNAKKTESGNGTTSKPSNQGFFGGDAFKEDLNKAIEAMDKKRQTDNMDIDQKIAEAKTKAKKVKEPNDVFGALKKALFPIARANNPGQDEPPDKDENDEFT